MPANPVQEKRDLNFIFGFPNPIELLVRVAITGEVQLSADNEVGVPVNVTLQPSDPSGPQRVYNLLEFAPIASWRASSSLLKAVGFGWLYVDVANVAAPAPVVGNPDFIPYPDNPVEGDLLVFNGVEWVSLPAGAGGLILTSNGVGTIPSYQPAGGGGGGGGSNILTGQVTAGLVDGDICYPSGPSTWSRARSDGTLIQAEAVGFFLGVAGEIALPGSSVPAARFTTVGGSPNVGMPVYLAASTDDAGTGAGKLTAVPPVTGFSTLVGFCVNNDNWGLFRTAVIVFSPEPALP